MSNQMILTPSAINKYLKAIIDRDKYLRVLEVEGEISNLKYHSSGNIYFSIKDNDAQISCVMFSSYANKLQEKFVEGDSIIIKGSFYLYVKSGQYNINVKEMKKKGTGDLAIKFLELKTKLNSEGLFNQSHKKSIPSFPQTIGIITSSTGAAIQDMLITLKNRYPIAKINIYPTLVQGSNSAKDIVRNIKRANLDSNDVLILSRGGGSIEDLWSFNEEIVARAIYDSKLPIISGVGHETDTTISDYVADVRAATPTAAAQIVVPDRVDILKNLNTYTTNMSVNLNNIIKNKFLMLDNITNVEELNNPLININLAFDNLTLTLNNLSSRNFEQLKNYEKNIKLYSENCQHYTEKVIEAKNLQLNHIHEVIDTLNPLSVLSRGYNVLYDDKKNVVKSIANIEIDSNVNIMLNDGSISAKVIGKESSEK